jgi:hypothetical protein
MKKYFLTLAFTLSVCALSAQPDNPNNPTPLPGIALLVAAGAAYGAKKMYDQKEE